MQTAAEQFKARIMRRVYAVWFCKQVLPLLLTEFILIAGVGIGVITQISIRQILLNALQASSNAWAFVMFFVSNFFVKSVQSRLLLVAYGVIVGFFVRDLRSAFRRLRSLGVQDLWRHLPTPKNRDLPGIAA